MCDSQSQETPALEKSGPSDSSADRRDHNRVPTRPRLHSRKSSGTMVISRDSYSVGPVDEALEPGDVRAMSPRRTSQDLKVLGQETRDELRRHAKALQDSLLIIYNRIEAVKQEHDKLDSNNKFLQKYIGDLMTTSKITASGSKGKR